MQNILYIYSFAYYTGVPLRVIFLEKSLSFRFIITFKFSKVNISTSILFLYYSNVYMTIHFNLLLLLLFCISFLIFFFNMFNCYYISIKKKLDLIYINITNYINVIKIHDLYKYSKI